MKNITQWQHLKKNYLAVMIFFIGMAITAYIIVEPEIWWAPIPFLTIALIIIPIGNYISWKNKP